jgi:hypothetical protein
MQIQIAKHKSQITNRKSDDFVVRKTQIANPKCKTITNRKTPRNQQILNSTNRKSQILNPQLPNTHLLPRRTCDACLEQLGSGGFVLDWR